MASERGAGGPLAGDLMSTPLVDCRPDDPLSEVARLMLERRVHAVLLRDGDEEAGEEGWAIVTDLDVIACALRGGATAADAASPTRTFVPADEPAELAARLMAERGCHHVVVVAPGGRRPVGILSSLDLVTVVGRRD